MTSLYNKIYDLFHQWLSTEEEDYESFENWLDSQIIHLNGKLYIDEPKTILNFVGTNFTHTYRSSNGFNNSLVDWGDGTIESPNQLQHTYTTNQKHTIKILNAPYDKNYCFQGCNMTAITIPSNVTHLGYYCFLNCSNLTDITIPSSVTSLDFFCFSGCTSLTNITIPSSVTSLPGSCFERCTGLTDITIPSSVTSIGDNCFYQCTSLTNITIPSGVTRLASTCFSGCTGLTDITIPSSVIFLGSDCFYQCTSLTSIDIPSSVRTLGSSCFEGCTSLTNVILNWTTDREFDLAGGGINYRENVFKNTNANLKFTIPPNTTDLYISKGYPSDKLQEATQ